MKFRNLRLMRPVAAACLAILCSITLVAAPGDLDPTFGTGGRVFTDVAPACAATVRSMAVQPDSRIVVAGKLEGCPGLVGPAGFVIRYLADGTVDELFGDDGRFVLKDGGGDAAVALQPDGGIIVRRPYRVVRLLPDGRLDSAFGRGAAASDILFPSRQIKSFAVQADGKILISAILPSGDAVGRLNAGGIL